MTELDTPGSRGYDWQKKSREVKSSDEYTCQGCGIHKDDRPGGVGLKTHHVVKGKWLPKEDARVDLNLATVCAQCHSLLEVRHPEKQLRDLGRESAISILEQLKEGSRTASMLSKKVDVDQDEIESILQELCAMRLVRKDRRTYEIVNPAKEAALRELVEDPRVGEEQ